MWSSRVLTVRIEASVRLSMQARFLLRITYLQSPRLLKSGNLLYLSIIGGLVLRNPRVLCVQFSAAHWFKAHFSRRYLPPMLTYAVALIVIGLPFLITHTGILRWAPLYKVLVALSMLSSWLRKERSLWGNAVSVIAASSHGETVETAFQHRLCAKPPHAPRFGICQI